MKIYDLSHQDRPREKLLERGKEALTDSELLGILLGSGNAEKNAVELSREILTFCNDNINRLAKLSVEDLCRFKGIGPAKAIVIVAALELSRRRKPEESLVVRSSENAFNSLKHVFYDKDVEEFWILLLNRANRIIKAEKISMGGVSGTVVDSKVVFRVALQNQASGIILAHNHPSGNLIPSSEDKKLTTKIKQAAQLLDINLLDHIIVCNEKYFSFADEGYMS